ncbi:hypothetical protein [Streptomyces bobili]
MTVTGYPGSREPPLTRTDRRRSYSRTQQRIDCPGLSAGTGGSPWVNGFG